MNISRYILGSAKKYKFHLIGGVGLFFILAHTVLYTNHPVGVKQRSNDENLFYDRSPEQLLSSTEEQKSSTNRPNIHAPLLSVPNKNTERTSEETFSGLETNHSDLGVEITGTVELTSKGEAIQDVKEKKPRKKSKIKDKDSDNVINIKPFLNFTASLLGINTVLPEDQKSLDPSDPATVFKSMFNIWNPKASNWALRTSKRFKKILEVEGEHGWNFTQHDSEKQIQVPMQHCNCTRTLLGRFPRDGSVSDSTCSSDTYLRGPGQKIIGFSFYGNPNSTKSKYRKYFQGIKENLDLVPELYPGWIIRVYYDLHPGDQQLTDLCNLACENTNLDICYVKNLPSSTDISKVFAMNWRFFPTLDPQVDLYISRDLDSRISSRETSAVSEWLNSPHSFHFMRDNPAHGIEILGSGWGVSLGVRNSTVRNFIVESFQEASKDPIFWAKRDSYGPDQGFLKRYFWPWGKWSSMSHDSYTCQRFPRTSPFPTQRELVENNFVASVVEARDVMKKECPEACRPKLHKDWIYC